MTDIGLYVHVPFCVSKCAYCDFYSFAGSESERDLYTARVIEEINRWGARVARPIDSLYLGGGTPSLLGGVNTAAIIRASQAAFGFHSPEITLEANPADNLAQTLAAGAEAGVNRLSLGVQTASERERDALCRRHTNDDVTRTVKDARAAGIDNISMDLMLGIPHSSVKSVRRSADFIMSHNPSHISVYMLKIEPGTPFYKNRPPLPSEGETVNQYVFTAEYLESHGYIQYEISNFAKPGFESRHNLRYWDCREYLGIGPSAHSFLDGRRFYYGRDYTAFMSGTQVTEDGKGGTAEEYIMLRLRLKEGIIYKNYEARYGKFPVGKTTLAEKYASGGFMTVSENGIALTRKGFLVSNTIIGEFI